MIRRNLFKRVLLSSLFLSSSIFVQVSEAQLGFSASDAVAPDPVQKVLLEGRRLESDERWGEALSHYEEAVRRYPQNNQLKQLVSLTRMRFDLDRRYADQSYVDALQQLSEQQAMDLFSEVILKIQSHYVRSPDWNDLLRRGTKELEIALKDQDFVSVNRVQVSPVTRDQLTHQIQNVLNDRRLTDRQHAEEMVRWIARYSARQLGISSTPIILEYMCGATNSLDTYSTYLTGDQLDDVYSQIEGNFVGLGVELKADEGALLIAGVIAKGPAESAGIKAGDRIVAVDGVSTRDLSTDRAADLLKGEQGSTVQVTVVSPDLAPRLITVRRDRVEVPSVEDVKMADAASGVAYFRISSFQKTTSRDVDAALWKLHRDGMRSLIVDVRGNPGGLLTEAVEVADRFVVDGTIVATHGRSARENYDYKAHRVGTWRVPLVVLIDSDSASASEIFAGAIRDHRRGTVVGIRSYGKGSVQGIFPLRSVKGGVRLTTAKFFSPSGQAISLRGVTPDVVIQSTAKPVEGVVADNESEDAVMKAGVKVAQNLVVMRDRGSRQDQSSTQQTQASRQPRRLPQTLGW
ncbi:MAG: S41 family peptidase [Pirellulaceae bacterium]|nr:S41 family peptidase [Pirellulaceae bacterium]